MNSPRCNSDLRPLEIERQRRDKEIKKVKREVRRERYIDLIPIADLRGYREVEGDVDAGRVYFLLLITT